MQRRVQVGSVGSRLTGAWEGKCGVQSGQVRAPRSGRERHLATQTLTEPMRASAAFSQVPAQGV